MPSSKKEDAANGRGATQNTAIKPDRGCSKWRGLSPVMCVGVQVATVREVNLVKSTNLEVSGGIMTPRNDHRSVFLGLARLGSSPAPMCDITTVRCVMFHIPRTAEGESSRKPRFGESEKRRIGGLPGRCTGSRL